MDVGGVCGQVGITLSNSSRDQPVLGRRSPQTFAVVARELTRTHEMAAHGAQRLAEIDIRDGGVNRGIEARDEGVVRVGAFAAHFWA